MITLLSCVKRMATTKMSRKVSIKIEETYEMTMDCMIQQNGWREERKELARNKKKERLRK
jgi:hypothetical protein